MANLYVKKGKTFPVTFSIHKSGLCFENSAQLARREPEKTGMLSAVVASIPVDFLHLKVALKIV